MKLCSPCGAWGGVRQGRVGVFVGGWGGGRKGGERGEGGQVTIVCCNVRSNFHRLRPVIDARRSFQ